MAIQPNPIPNEPELQDLLDLHARGVMLDFNCHHIGVVKAFDATRQVAQVQIAYKKTYFEPNALGVVVPVLVDFPVIVDAPVIFLGGGGFALTFPVEAGDECLVVFNDRDIDRWFAGLANGELASARLHSFSDAFVLVGIRSLKNVILDFDNDGLAVRNRLGTTKIKVTDDTVTVEVGPNAVFEIGLAGTIKFTNAAGELISTLVQLFSPSTTAGGNPLVADPAAYLVLQSMLAP